MSITFDIISMPPKSQEASQIQTNEINKLQQENQQLASQFEAEVRKSSEQAIRRNKAENEELRNEERRRQQKRKKKAAGRAGSTKDDDSEEEKKEEVAFHFDMRI